MVERTKFHSAFVINIQFTSNYLKISIHSRISVRPPLIHYKPLRMRKPETNFHFHYCLPYGHTKCAWSIFSCVLYISADFWHTTTIIHVRTTVSIRKTYDVRRIDMRTKYGVNFLTNSYHSCLVIWCTRTLYEKWQRQEWTPPIFQCNHPQHLSLRKNKTYDAVQCTMCVPSQKKNSLRGKILMTS